MLLGDIGEAKIRYKKQKGNIAYMYAIDPNKFKPPPNAQI